MSKRGLIASLGIILVYILVSLAVGRAIPTTLTYALILLVALLIFITIFENKIKIKLKHGKYWSALFSLYIFILFTFAVVMAFSYIMGGMQIPVIKRFLAFLGIFIPTVLVIAYLGKLMGLDKYLYIYEFRFRDFLKFLLIVIVGVIILGAGMIFLEQLGIVSWR